MEEVRATTELTAAQLAETHDHLFGEAICEVILRRISTQVLEGKDGQHGRARTARAGDCFSRNVIDLADRAIATTRQSFHEPRRLRGIAQSLTEFVDGGAETVIEIDDGIGSPKTP
jgi:hypothetical protein